MTLPHHISAPASASANTDKVLLDLQASLASEVGQHFFEATVVRLNALVNADITLIGYLQKDRTEVKTLALCNREGLQDNITYALAGSPCEDVSTGGSCVIEAGVAGLYPNDQLLKDLGVEGYVGVAIVDSSCQPIGIAVSLFGKPVSDPSFVKRTFQFLAERIRGEMERTQLEQRLRHNEERLALALKAGSFGVYDWNVYTDELVFDERLYEIIGYTPDEFKPSYAKWVSLVHPDDYEMLAVNIQRKVISEREFHGPNKYRILTKGGRYKWIEAESYSFFYDTSLKAKRNVGIVKEIDNLVRTEGQLRYALDRELMLNQQLSQREQWYAFALKVGELAVYDWYVKEDRSILSPTFYELIGYAPDEIRMNFERWMELVHPDDRGQFRWYVFQQQEADSQNTRNHYRLMHRSGEYRWVESQNMAIERDSVGHITRMIGIIKDVDSEKRSADLLKQAFEKERELNARLQAREQELTESQAKLISQMTILQKLNKELQESDNRWEYALQSNGDGVVEWNIQTNECYFSERAKEIFGFPLNNEEDYKTFVPRIHPDAQAEFRTNLALCLKPPYEHFLMETQMADEKGNYRWLMLRGKVVELDERATPLKLVGTVTDLSGNKVIQKELTVYEEMIKQNQSAILFLSMRGTIEFVNHAAAELLEYRQHEIIEKNVSFVLESGSAEHLMTESFRGQQILLTRSRRAITTQVATSIIRHDGEPIGYALNIMDISERKRLEDEVLHLTMSKLEGELAAQRRQTEMIIHVQENEKESIARELHDGIGQLMSLAKLQLEQLESLVPAELRGQCKGVVDLMQHITTDLKGMTSDLMPLSLRNLGLESAVTSLLERYQALRGNHVLITCKIFLQGYEPDERTAMHIYRIAQEAVNNAMKYSGASVLSFMLVKLKNSLNLIVEDNGCGFDLESQLHKKNSFGLKTMMERAKLVNGKLIFNTAPNNGTTISLTIPLHL